MRSPSRERSVSQRPDQDLFFEQNKTFNWKQNFNIHNQTETYVLDTDLDPMEVDDVEIFGDADISDI